MELFKITDRVNIDSKDVYENYKKVLSLYNDSISRGDYGTSYLFITSLLEERVTVCWVLREWFERSNSLDENSKPTIDETFSVINGVGKKMEYLHERGYFSKKKLKSFKSRLGNRNVIVHYFMWNFDKIGRDKCDKIYETFRFFDGLSSQIKKEIGFKREE